MGRRERLAFGGIASVGRWLPGVRFEFDTSWFDSFLAYERELVGNLRLLQQVRWLERRGEVSLTELRLPAPAAGGLARIEVEILEELCSIRRAVDSELDEGRGRRCVVEALRASPQRPASVVEYASMAAFVEEDRRRGMGRPPDREDGGGADLGAAWRVENPFRRWETTAWRISWLCNTDKDLFGGDDDAVHGGEDGATCELYAFERYTNNHAVRCPRRVWLLGTLHTRARVNRALDDLRLYAMHERNSLIAAAAAVAAAGAQEKQDGALSPGGP